MSPWTILGWLLVAAIAIPFLLTILATLFGLWKLFLSALTKRFRYYATRNIPPQEGQMWNQNGSTLKITLVRPDGPIVVRSGNASWSESLADWKKRVRNRKLVLIYNPNKA